jgi:hypothetical protein
VSGIIVYNILKINYLKIYQNNFVLVF